MKISKKTDYALRTLFTLIEHYDSKPVPIRELAYRNNMPRRFLEHIMLELKAEGWVDSVSGKNGGYTMAKHPGEITMGQIVRHFDGVLAPIGCVSVTKYQRCSEENVCRFRALLIRIRDYAADLLDRATLEEVYQNFLDSRKPEHAGHIDGDGI